MSHKTFLADLGFGGIWRHRNPLFLGQKRYNKIKYMTQDSSTGWSVLVLLGFVGWLAWSIGNDVGHDNGFSAGYEAGQQSIIEEELAACEYAIEEYGNILNQLNDQIEEARWMAWSSYEEMGYTLESLETIESY